MNVVKLLLQIKLYEVLVQCILALGKCTNCALQLPENAFDYQTYLDVTSEQSVTQN